MFTGKPEQRILQWRDLRQSLGTWPQDYATVAQAWTKAPLSNHYLTWQDHGTWPGAWQLINDNIWCDASVALGMFYTIYYSDYPLKHTLELRHYQLREQQRDLNLLCCEDMKYVLNYSYGEVVNTTRMPPLPSPAEILRAADLNIRK
jgi:hypothetical protein